MKRASLNFKLIWKRLYPDLPLPTVEHTFLQGRKWRLDYAWPDLKVGFEIEGGVWGQRGRHVRAAGYEKDCTKYSCAAVLGWQIIRATTRQLQHHPKSVCALIAACIKAQQSGDSVYHEIVLELSEHLKI